MCHFWSLISNITSYGPAGEEVILATLRYHIFPSSKNAPSVLANTLADSFVSEQEMSDRAPLWKNFRPTSFLLEDFMHFIAGPFVANLLISEDNGITQGEADVLRRASAHYGQYVHSTSEVIDDLVMEITVLRRVRRLMDCTRLYLAYRDCSNQVPWRRNRIFLPLSWLPDS